MYGRFSITGMSDTKECRNSILFTASECVPFVKTGGLADVVGALPKEFDSKYWDIRVVLPCYTCIPDKFKNQFKHIGEFNMQLGDKTGEKYVGIKEYCYNDITYYFIDNLEYFDCFYPYSEDRWDIEKFIFFSKATLSILPVVGFKPDIIHCHDWQTGLIPVYLKTMFMGNMFYWGIRTVITIHNLKFQGIWDIETIQGLSGIDDSLFTADKLEFNKNANMLKGGLVYADYITTVSPSYAQEIQGYYYGEGLDGLLSSRHFDMQGIVNGIDYDLYNPSTDKDIYRNFNIKNFRRNKKINKTRLQDELGITVDSRKFTIGLVSRLTDQKGFDLINYCLERILDEFTQIIVVGTGEAKYENTFRHFAWKYPQRLSANIFYSEELSKKVYAGCDAFLMPSRFEPCGLSQLISLRYGTVPIVRGTGGLLDTVIPYNEYENTGNGFSFLNYNGEELLDTVNYAKTVYFERKRWWNQIVERGMNSDFSWKKSREKYEELYHFLIGD